MRMLTLSRWRIGVLYSCFLVVFVTVVSISSLRVSNAAATTVNASSIDPSTDLKQGPFLVRSPTVTPFNQELWFQGNVRIRVPKNHTGKKKRFKSLFLKVTAI